MLIALPFESLVGLLVSAWIPVPILLLIQQPQHIYFQNAILWNKGYHLSCMRFVVTLTYKYSAYFILLCMCVCVCVYIYIYIFQWSSSSSCFGACCNCYIRSLIHCIYMTRRVFTHPYFVASWWNQPDFRPT